MSDDTFYRLSDDDLETVSRAGMKAAWSVFQMLNNEEVESREAVILCVLAIKAAREATKSALDELMGKPVKGVYVSNYPEIMHIVCSAAFFMDLGAQDLHTVNPLSLAGWKISCLVDAARALDALDNVYTALDGVGISTSSIDDLWKIANKDQLGDAHER
jgi:hypothetical protein